MTLDEILEKCGGFPIYVTHDEWKNRPDYCVTLTSTVTKNDGRCYFLGTFTSFNVGSSAVAYPKNKDNGWHIYKQPKVECKLLKMVKGE